MYKIYKILGGEEFYLGYPKTPNPILLILFLFLDQAVIMRKQDTQDLQDGEIFRCL